MLRHCRKSSTNASSYFPSAYGSFPKILSGKPHMIPSQSKCCSSHLNSLPSQISWLRSESRTGTKAAFVTLCLPQHPGRGRKAKEEGLAHLLAPWQGKETKEEGLAQRTPGAEWDRPLYTQQNRNTEWGPMHEEAGMLYWTTTWSTGAYHLSQGCYAFNRTTPFFTPPNIFSCLRARE